MNVLLHWDQVRQTPVSRRSPFHSFRIHYQPIFTIEFVSSVDVHQIYCTISNLGTWSESIWRSMRVSSLSILRKTNKISHFSLSSTSVFVLLGLYSKFHQVVHVPFSKPILIMRSHNLFIVPVNNCFKTKEPTFVLPL